MVLYRSASVSIFIALAWVFAGGCGDDESAPCSAASCPSGCCDVAGKCQLWSATSCGLVGQAGEACLSCGSGQSCPAGICQTGTGSCSIANCPGCCTAAGRCSVGTTSLECGNAGAACQSCSAGQQCQSGYCQTSTCSSATCTGCCDDRGECLGGTGEGACGLGGVSCKVCGSGLTCSVGHCVVGVTCQNGHCVVGVTCQNCAGCCDSGGNCITTPTDSMCGTGGTACQTCGTGQACQNGICTCDPSSCSGCCAGNNCLSGTAVSACGVGGSSCAVCPDGTSCVGGQCGTGCSFETCLEGCCAGSACNVGGETDSHACGRAGATCQACDPSMLCENGSCNDPRTCSTLNCGGCCLEGRCELGTDQTACGGGGQTCTTCSSYEYCSPLKTCEVKPESVWKVILEHVVIDEDEGEWIDLFDPPDIYV
ncbi:MAG: hypothetical protein JRH20_24285, partial [Deltaproteobacteria bacterium]|nr:hypothetical protein [Deltaproteobacteria bacterium]